MPTSLLVSITIACTITIAAIHYLPKLKTTLNKKLKARHAKKPVVDSISITFENKAPQYFQWFDTDILKWVIYMQDKSPESYTRLEGSYKNIHTVSARINELEKESKILNELEKENARINELEKSNGIH